jgi:hypothetical protein
MIKAKQSKTIPESRRDDIISVIPSGFWPHQVHVHCYNPNIPSGFSFINIL